MRRRHWAERPFAAITALLPRSVREADGDAIRRTFAEQLDEAPPGYPAVRVALRGLAGAAGAVIGEWLDGAGWTDGPIKGPKLSTGRGGMGWIRNMRHAARSLRRAPSFTATTVLLVGLGVGTVTTVFTVVDDVLLRPLEYPAAERLTYLTNGSHNGETLRRLDDVEAFDLWTATSGASVILTRAGADPAQLRRVETTPSFFTIFGARPALGRLIVEADRDRTDLVVLTHTAWSEIWGADPDIVGSTIQLDGIGVEVVGVLTSDFVLPTMLVGDPVNLFRPIDWTNPGLQESGYHAHSVVARLTAGASIDVADEQLQRVAADVAATDPDYYSDGPPEWPLQGLHERTVEDVRSGLILLLGAVGLLLLVACANVAHLFMARGLSRGREMAIRRAVGARSGNILAGLAAESLAVGLAGGLVALVLAKGALSALGALTSELPRGATVDLDARIFLFGVALATLTALLFGMLPAMRALGRDLQTTLRGGGRGVTGGRGVEMLRSSLVVGEVALSLVLVASAALLMRSFLAVTAQPPGIVAEGLYVVPLAPQNIEDADTYRQRMDRVRTALRAVPGVEAVTYAIEAPFEFTGGDRCCWSGSVTPDGDDTARPYRVSMHPSSPDYFETYGIELLAGAAWTESEAGDAPLRLVMNEELAIRMFGSADAALGRMIEEPREGRVVGVAAGTRHYGMDQEHGSALYFPIEALPFPIDRATVGIRMRDAEPGLGRGVREAVWSVEPDLPVPTVVPMTDWVARSSSGRRLASMLLSAFGTIALLLAAAGLYGTLLYAVGQQRRELGIRMALGAGRRDIHTRVIARGFTLAVLGIGVGALVSWWFGRLLEGFLFGVSATDPIALTGAALTLLGTAVLASWLPALRAARTDPLETLRAE
jgi:predicted permease